MIKVFFQKYRRQITFIVIGGWNTIFGFAIFSLLYLLLQPLFKIQYFAYTSAQIVATFLALVSAFICHKFITFKSQVRGKGILPEFGRFCMVYTFSYIFDFLIMPFLVEVAHWHPILVAATTIPVKAIISYTGHFRFSFYQPGNPA